MDQSKNAVELSATNRRRLRRVIDQLGEREVVGRIGCAPETVLRSLAGLPQRRGTVALIERALDEIEAAAAA